MKSFFTLLIPLTLAVSALAHGFVSKITIDGKAYKGTLPTSNAASEAKKKPSIVRLITDMSPVHGANNPSVNCGPGAGPAMNVAEALPGSTVSFEWSAGNQNWPHNTGPMLTYMASCGSSTCDKFDSTKAKWFKIDEVGRKPNSNDWVQGDLMNGAPAVVKIPKTLASGNYLIRHEIIALHLAETKGKAEFYPSCAQLHVGGSQTGAPKASELVSLPGAYSDNDPGIFTHSAFDRRVPYVFPGPKVAAFVSGAPASGNNPPKAAADKGHCKLKRVASVDAEAAAAAAATIVPRHLSRVMRGLVAGHAPSS